MATVFTALPTVAISNPHRPARPMKSTPWANGWPIRGNPQLRGHHTSQRCEGHLESDAGITDTHYCWCGGQTITRRRTCVVTLSRSASRAAGHGKGFLTVEGPNR